jgi:hypothetical protein
MSIIKSHMNSSIDIVKYQIRSKSGEYLYAKTISYKMKDGCIYCITRKLSFFEILILILFKR